MELVPLNQKQKVTGLVTGQVNRFTCPTAFCFISSVKIILLSIHMIFSPALFLYSFKGLAGGLILNKNKLILYKNKCQVGRGYTKIDMYAQIPKPGPHIKLFMDKENADMDMQLKIQFYINLHPHTFNLE